jgi:uncharacterized protein (TIGR02996 family)
MSDEAGFLKSIADQPGDRTARLVYADWLDEHDRRSEAEFLRLQIQVADLNTKLLELDEQLDTTWQTAVGNVATESMQLTVRSGRGILLRELRQWNFYAGWLEGGPTSEENRADLEQLVRDETERGHGLEPYLIQPVERIIPPRDGSPLRRTRAYFPPIACVARFVSYSPARDNNHDGSTLTIIWFQRQFAYPVIEPAIREQIRAIDWEKHAHDWDW